MTQQEMIDQNLRLLLGDMQVQLIFAKAQIADLQQQLEMATPKDGKPNGGIHPFTERPIVAEPPGGIDG